MEQVNKQPIPDQNNFVEDFQSGELFIFKDRPGYGEHMASECPICGKMVNELGDFKNPSVIITGEKMCDDCKKQIRALLHK